MKIQQLGFFILGLWICSSASAHDFNTTETVRYVVECMADLGKQSEENLYTCACRLDALGAKINYDKYADAKKFISYKKMPGEKGALFRDNKQGNKVIELLSQAEKYADSKCIQVRGVRADVYINNEE